MKIPNTHPSETKIQWKQSRGYNIHNMGEGRQLDFILVYCHEENDNHKSFNLEQPENKPF